MKQKIYVASKTKHAPMWKQLRDEGFPIVSSWIDEAGLEETLDWNDLWSRCINEASTATTLIVYVLPGEILKGALVEVGAALSHNVPIIIIGNPTKQGSWWKSNNNITTLSWDRLDRGFVRSVLFGL